jgi:hypothetical protein
MWILPKNYPLSSHFAQDMVASKEDLTLQGLNIEQSLMSKSKPTRLRTWQTRWKQGNFYQHLFGRILKPCQYSLFETKLTSLLAAIHVSPLVQQGSDLEKMTQDTCGLTLGDTSNQLDLFSASLKTSKDILVLDSEKSLATWKASVIEQRGEYSVRVKLALLTRENESTSWLTPVVQDSKHSGTNPSKNGKRGLLVNQVNWPTPTARDHKGHTITCNYPKGFTTSLPNEVMVQNAKNWPTPTTQDASKATKKMRDNHQNNLTAVVFSQEKLLPTPTARDWRGGYRENALTRKDGKSRRFDSLPNAAIGGVGVDIVPGHLNPDWVEWLMGVPTGWTGLGSWGTE